LFIIPLHCELERPPAPAAAMDRVRHVCASESCATAEKYDADRLCAGCRSTFYCSPECQRADWNGHKPACKVATAEREASQIVRVSKGGGSAPPAAAPERVGPPASLFVAGAARSEAEALCRPFQQAATQGYAVAQYCLGELHRDGQGVPKDVARAVALFKQAAAGGEKDAVDALRAMGDAVAPGARRAPDAAGAPLPMY